MTKPKKSATPSPKKTSDSVAAKKKAPISPAPISPAPAPAASTAKVAAAKPVPTSKSSDRTGGAPKASSAGGKGRSAPTPAGGKPLVAPAKSASKSGRNGAGSASGASEEVPAPDAPLVPRKLPKGGPSKSDLKRYRERLLELRRALLASSRDLEAEVLKSSGTEFSVDHMADNGSDNYEHDFSLKLLEGEAEQLAEIREALLKIDGKLDPPYGVCEACADVDQKLCPTCPWIPAARLDAMPHARMCVQTKELDERRRR